MSASGSPPTLESFLPELGRIIGLPSLKLDNGVCRLVFDGATVVDLEPDDTGAHVLLSASLGEVPAGLDTSVPALRSILEANRDLAADRGVALALLPREREVFLCGIESVSALTGASLATRLAAFVHECRRCARVMTEIGQQAATESPTSGELAPASFIRV